MSWGRRLLPQLGLPAGCPCFVWPSYRVWDTAGERQGQGFRGLPLRRSETRICYDSQLSGLTALWWLRDRGPHEITLRPFLPLILRNRSQDYKAAFDPIVLVLSPPAWPCLSLRARFEFAAQHPHQRNHWQGEPRCSWAPRPCAPLLFILRSFLKQAHPPI